jgi:hypothetical protein
MASNGRAKALVLALPGAILHGLDLTETDMSCSA